jgi:AcrR family transcriptional regulator
VTPRANDDERPARPDRRTLRSADTRGDLLAAAVALLAEHDVDGFSLRQVAEAAGYAPPTVYLHFADKDDLLFHAAQAGCATFGARLTDAAAGERDPIDRIEAIGRAYVEFGLAHPVEYGLMFLRRGDMLLRATADGPAIIDGFDVLTEAVEAAMTAGVLPEQPSREVAAWLWTTVHGIVGLHLSVPGIDADAARAFYERTARVLRDGFYIRT